jgi:hypothetical protein
MTQTRDDDGAGMFQPRVAHVPSSLEVPELHDCHDDDGEQKYER